MTVYFIYSPFTGQVISLNCYCYRRTYDPCNPNVDCPGSPSPYCKDKTTCLSCADPCFCKKCCYHVVVGEASGYCCPLDISQAAGARIRAYIGANIKSIKYLHMSGVCASYTGDINNGVWLETWTDYNATGKRLGRLLYAHVANRLHPDGWVTNQPGVYVWTVDIGDVPSVPGGQTCYLSTHVHLSIWADTGVSKSRTSGYNCGDMVYQNSSAIYWWTW